MKNNDKYDVLFINKIACGGFIMDTVLVGGISVLIIAGLMWLIHARVEASDMSPKAKRVVNYGLILLIVAAAIIAIDWHNSTWLAARQ